MAKHIGDLVERAAGVEKPTDQSCAGNAPSVRQPGATIRLAHGMLDDLGGHCFITGATCRTKTRWLVVLGRSVRI